jgi:flagellar biosynthetic protein FlhB
MAETPVSDRTEQPTPKRLDDARRRGQVPRSRELAMASVLMAGSVILFAGQGQLGGDIRELMVRALSPSREMLADPAYLSIALADIGFAVLNTFTPLLVTLAAAAILGTIAIGGWFMSATPLQPKFERLNPIAGLGRIFSINGLVEVLKALAKATIIGGFAIAYIAWSGTQLLGLSNAPVGGAMAESLSLTLMTLGICSLALLLIAAVDAPYQLWSWRRQLRMTRQEVIDELKETEGRPEVRSRIRQMQQEVAQRRMLVDMVKADVVVTNPTHFAVALRYEDNRMRAPVVLAKGADHVAARMRAVAAERKITLFEAPVLARALYWTTDIGQEIPSQLYLAVAQVLTYVYRLRAVHERGGEWPEKPAVNVDEKLALQPARRRRRR